MRAKAMKKLKRAEAHRRERDKAKIVQKAAFFAQKFPGASPTQIADLIGLRVDEMYDWGDRISDKSWDDTMDYARKTLNRAESFCSVVNLVGTLYAVESTFGDLKTIKRRMTEFVENFCLAQDHITEVGVRAALEAITKKYDLQEIEFEDFDPKELYDFEEEMNKSKQEIRESADEWEREWESRQEAVL